MTGAAGLPARRGRRLAAGLLLLALLAGCGDRLPRIAPLAPDAPILAFGDSLTRGTGAADDQSYPAVLAALSGREVINAGVPGELSEAGRRRLPALLDRHAPGLLILCHGGNDLLRQRSVAALGDNLRAMVDAARTRGIPVVLIGVPKPGLTLGVPGVYADIAGEYGLAYDDTLLSGILRKPALKSDHVHPNAAGYRVMAETLHALLVGTGAL